MKRISLLIVAGAAAAFLSACALTDFWGNNSMPTLVPVGPGSGTVTPIPTMPEKTPTPAEVPTKAEAPTEKPTATPTETPTPTEEPTPTPTNTPTPTPEPYTAAQCREALAKKIGNAYTISEAKAVKVGSDSFYSFTVSDKDRVYQPDIIVNIKNMALWYYYPSTGEMLALESFPLDKGEKVEPTGAATGWLTAAEATNILKTIPLSVLGLSKDITTYTVEVDPVITTNIHGVDCYNIDVFEAVGNDKYAKRVGVYCISFDRVSVYKALDERDFEMIK
ncbi:MAG: hypothetical protein J6U10_01020 [Lachnospiraceae bacterium]|nr:hypothetical protein [Lachnospiraceae bacterium]